MATVAFKKLILVTDNGYDYPVIESELGYKDGTTRKAYFSIFREAGYQFSGTIEGEWDLGSYYFPEDPVKRHLESKLSFFRYLEEKGREAMAAKPNLSINLNEETKNILFDFARAAWVAYTNNNRMGKRVSEEDFAWYVKELNHVDLNDKEVSNE